MTPHAHIAVFSFPTHGHVNPSLEVIRELVARGHRVTYAIPPVFADKVAETGAELKLWNSRLPSPDDDATAWGSSRIETMELGLADAIQVLPQLNDAYSGDVPDLILHDVNFHPAFVLAHRWRVPAVSLSPKCVAWKGHEDVVVAVPTWVEQKKTERGRAYYARLQRWLEENGITEHPDHFLGRPARSIVLISRALQPHPERVDEHVHTFVGSCWGERAGQLAWQRPAGAQKVVLVSLGSIFTNQPGFYRECVKAFSTLPGWHLVLQTGWHVDPAALGDIPHNVEVHSWGPQRAVLEQADLFVTHAGSGSSNEGLAAGTPMLAVPQAADQFSNAGMLQSLGVARHVNMGEANAATLRASGLALVDDPEVAWRLEHIRAEMAGEGGTCRAADIVEAELAAHKARAAVT
ncbi:macrolide family glycosyltransferase [Streptomyces sp. NPDC059680]|uniref:macrolide family glycosyltransferase n=1 Tax=Streptomyces sp. NPDC059680 TaxID=3346904 RepID=UPI0036827EAD